VEIWVINSLFRIKDSKHLKTAEEKNTTSSDMTILSKLTSLSQKEIIFAVERDG